MAKTKPEFLAVVKKLRDSPGGADVELSPEEIISLNYPFPNSPACEQGYAFGRYFHMSGSHLTVEVSETYAISE